MRENAAEKLGLNYSESCDILKGYGSGEVKRLGEVETELSIDSVRLKLKIQK